MAAGTVIQIPSELFAVAESSHFEGQLDLGLLSVGPDDYRFGAPVSWSVDITNTGSAFLVSGTATGSATCPCARCLEDAPFDFEGSIEGYVLIEDSAGDEFEDGDELGEDEFEVLPADHMLDLEPMILAALHVDAPNTPLCDPDCKGLCPQCGANLNEGACGCGQDPELAAFEEQANPFSVLSQLKFDD